MPIVIPAASGSTSALQSVPTQNVFDYLYDTQNNPLKGAPVVITLNVEAANAITPQVELSNIVIVTTTDNNGFWSVNLIPNANINPANTTYSVQVQGIPAYQIAIPSAGGPFQSTNPAVLVNTPGVLAPATTGITGNLTVSGNETVSGTLGVTGATTLGQLTSGATTTGAATVGGDLTIASAFRMLFGAAVSKLVPGATSFSVRDNTDGFDNLLVANGGDVTVRARLLLAAAVSKLVPGATSFSVRDNADANDNLLVSNAGAVTVRNGFTVNAGNTSLAAHALATGSAPTLGALQTNVSSQSVGAGSNDIRGTVSITTGNPAPGIQSTVAILQFNASFASAPVVVVCTGQNSNSAFSVNQITTTQCSINCISALSTTTTYIINYVVIG